MLDGRPFLGEQSFKVAKKHQRRILYANFDEPRQLFADHVFKRHLDERFLAFHRGDVGLDCQFTEHCEAFSAALVKSDVGVLMLDVASSMFFGDENLNAEVVALCDNLVRMIRTAHLDGLLLLTHKSKVGAVRGLARRTTAWETKPDCIWRLTRGTKTHRNERWFNWEGRIPPPDSGYQIVFNPRTYSDTVGTPASTVGRLEESPINERDEELRVHHAFPSPRDGVGDT